MTLVYPLDYARTRLANDSGPSKGCPTSLALSLSITKVSTGEGARKFTGIIDLFRKTVKSDGMVGIYRGFCVSVVGVFVYRGLYFGLYDSIKPLIGVWRENWIANFLLGWVVTITAGMAYYPIDTVRRRITSVLPPHCYY